MKKRLIYLSPDCFFDTDALVMRRLAEEYDLTWVALVTANGSRVSDDSVVESIAREAGVKLVLKKLYWRKFSWQQLRFDLGLLRELKAHRADLFYIEDFGDLFFYLLQPLFLKQKTTVYALHDVVPHSNHTDLRSKLQSSLFGISRRLLIAWARNYHIFSRTEYRKFRELYPSKNAFYTRLLLKSFGSPAKADAAGAAGETGAAGDIAAAAVTVAAGPGSVKNHCKLLFFGLIEYYKGLDLLIEAVELLVAEGFANFSLTIAGSGPYWPKCETLIRSTQHYDLRIRYIPDEEIPGLFANHHFMVLPYRDASQSGPQMISLEYKLPVIASDVEGLSDFIENEETGFVFSRAGTADKSLTEILRHCLAMSDESYTHMRHRLSVWTEQHYRIDDTIARYVHFFNERMKNNS